jgi:hypothetical protein
VYVIEWFEALTWCKNKALTNEPTKLFEMMIRDGFLIGSCKFPRSRYEKSRDVIILKAYFDANICVWGEYNGDDDDDGSSTYLDC